MPAAAASDSLLGVVLELDVGPVAHGGHCVARVGDDAHGRVIFVRHALPGERVRVHVRDKLLGARVVKLPFVRQGRILINLEDEERETT